MAPSKPTTNKLPPYPSSMPAPDKISRSRLLELAEAHALVAARLTPESKRAYIEKDRFRFEELPAAISKRRGKGSSANKQWTSGWIEKGELERLMDWKLHRGTWRPTLPGLIRSNAAEQVVHDTAEALALLEPCLTKSGKSAPFPKAALKAGAKLRGVGPATASLILAAAAPDTAPFMADETYAWFFGRRPEKYNEKELQALWDEVQALRTRLDGVSAAEIEKAVVVMAWARDGKVEGWAEGESGAEVEEDEKKEKEKQGASAKRGTKVDGKAKGSRGKVEGGGRENKRKVEEDEDEGEEKAKSQASSAKSGTRKRRHRGSD